MNTDGIIGHRRQIQVLDRLLKKNRIPHTLLFHGIPGIGKRMVARRFLAALFCEADNPPCGICPSCVQAEAGTHPDLITIAPDARGTIPIGDHDRPEQGTVRWLIERLSRRSIAGRCGVLIDAADLMRQEAQNALLKTVEEPQEGAHIVMIAASRSPILPTIRSRATEIAFYPLSPSEVRAVLDAAGSGGDHALAAEISGGSVETALRLCEEDTIRAIEGICLEIASYLEQGTTLSLDLSDILKKIGPHAFLSILTAVYRLLVTAKLRRIPLHPRLAAYADADEEKLIAVLKILLALRKGLPNNLNLHAALKGMLYRIETIGRLGLPDIAVAEMR